MPTSLAFVLFGRVESDDMSAGKVSAEVEIALSFRASLYPRTDSESAPTEKYVFYTGF